MSAKTTTLFGLAFLSACGGVESNGGAMDAAGDSNAVDTGKALDESSEARSLVEGGDAGAMCSSGLGCASGLVCAYLIADGCSAAGTCVMPPPPLPCNALCSTSMCGCGGSRVGWEGCCRASLPSGYAPAPVKPPDDAGTCN